MDASAILVQVNKKHAGTQPLSTKFLRREASHLFCDVSLITLAEPCSSRWSRAADAWRIATLIPLPFRFNPCGAEIKLRPLLNEHDCSCASV